MTGPYDTGTKRLGDVLCDVPCAIPFGRELVPGVLNPAYEIITTATAQVRASTAGVVTRVMQNPAPQVDYEIHIEPEAGSNWLVIYDHVNTATVTAGDTVVAGTVLGTAGDWDVSHGRVELQINDNALNISVCPVSLGTTAFNADHDAWLAAHNLEFPGSTYPSVCLEDTVVP